MPTTLDQFQSLAGTLPSGQSDNVDVQARLALHLLVDPILTGVPDHSPIKPDPSTCPNCGEPCASPKSPYCSNYCREASALVRQFRSSVGNGALLGEERQIAMGEKLWKLLGGLYPRRQAMAPPRSLKTVFQRQEGKCEVCGAPATTVDNVGSG